MSDLGRALIRQLDADDVAALRLLLVVVPSDSVDTEKADNGLPLLTVAEAAALCHCHAETVRRAISSGKLAAVKIGSRYRVDRRALEAWGHIAADSQPVARRQNRSRRKVAASPMRDAATHLHLLPSVS